jgi:diguanylate cyclase (GGDEF)-like protein
VAEISAEIQSSRDVITRLLDGERLPPFERCFRKKDGQILPVEVNVELIHDQDGQPLHIQSMVRDISQRKQAEEALHAANEQLSLRVAEVEQLQAELREQALHDPLTGLYNRRYLTEMLGREVARTKSEQTPLSIIVSDIDLFKNINDNHGHQVGDRFLVAVAKLMTASTRGSDVVCRYGGEEFIILMPGASLPAAAQRAEALRQACAALCIRHEGQALSITMSFGVAALPDHGQEAEQVIIKADKAMYQSKQAGRNQVTVWSDLL